MNKLFKVTKRKDIPKIYSIVVPTLSILAALISGAFFMLFMGFNPIVIYKAMFTGSFGSFYGFMETLVKATPLMLSGLGVAIAFRMQLFNIGAQGQIYMGAFAASGVALFCNFIPDPLVLPAMFLAGFIVGGLWGLLPAIPRVFMNVSETITTLMLNYVAILWVDFLVYGSWKDPKGFNFPLTAMFKSSATLPVFVGTRVHMGLIVALIAMVILYIVFKKTSWGYQISVIGNSKRAAEYSGMNIKTNILLVMFVSGGLSGLAGMCEVSGVIGRLQHTIIPDIGYTAIIVAYLSKFNPISVVIVSILFGGMLTGGSAIQVLGLTSQVVNILQGSILFFVLGGEILTRYQISFKKEKKKEVSI